MANINESIKKGVEEDFLKILTTSFKENLKSVMLYGSFVSGNFIKGVSDINILIILKNVEIDQIQNMGKNGFKLMKRHKITPLILSKDEFLTSADVFPMEYMDIHARNKLIYGEDESKALTLIQKNLRHQMEHQLRGTLISLRQLVVASRGKDKVLSSSIKAWYGSLNAIFKGLLRLKGIKSVPENANEMLIQIKEAFKLDTGAFHDLIQLRSGEKKDISILIKGLTYCLNSLIETVDKMD